MRQVMLWLCLVLAVTTMAQQSIYLDESKNLEERVDDALARLTEQEKQALLESYALPQTSGVPRLGIQPFCTDVAPNALFPSFACLMATWDVDLARQYGCKVAEQALYRRIDRLYDPALTQTDVDPCISAAMIPSYVEGVHSYGVEVYDDGKAMEQLTDEALLRQILRVHLEKTMSRQRPMGFLGTEEQSATAMAVAEAGLVLLKNENNLLPLKGHTVRTLWLVGTDVKAGPSIENQVAQRGVTVRCEPLSLNDATMKSGTPDIVIFMERMDDPPTLPLLKGTPVVIQAWDLGPEGAVAIAAVLCGEVNPSGKLPYTWPAENEEDPPLFYLGQGLSYSNFEFTDFTLSSREVPAGGDIIGTVTVTNIGDREGEEVVQLYIHDIKTSLPKPDKELKGFQKVNLKPGESKELTFTINEQTLMFFDPGTQQWIAEPGFYVAFIGNGADNLPVKARFHLR